MQLPGAGQSRACRLAAGPGRGPPEPEMALAAAARGPAGLPERQAAGGDLACHTGV